MNALRRSFARLLAAGSLLLPVIARAHPGHSAFDWFTSPPHAGHESEWTVLAVGLVLGAFCCGLVWLSSRKK